MNKTIIFGFLCAAVVMGVQGVPSNAEAKDQSEIVAAEISTFAKHLSVRPETAIDLSGVSGAYCFNAGLGAGGHMTHYAIDPENTTEDVIDFVNAKSFVKAGINVDDLPKFPGKLGAMKANQWYFLSPGEKEPHHGRTFPFPLMIRATNLE